MGKPVNFGWRMNAGMDGFEQPHGRFTAEVFWSDRRQEWGYVIWNHKDEEVEKHSTGMSLEAAKTRAHKRVSALEADSLGIKNKSVGLTTA